MPGALSFQLDDAAFQRMARQLRDRDVKIAAVWALNDTAADVLTHVQDRMDVVFDRPTRFTKNAFMVKRATTSRLEASVQERPSVGARHYLKVQETGGTRPQTGVERALSVRLPYGGVIRSVLPASGGGFDAARLDQFGNWSGGQRNIVLSELGAQLDTSRNATERSRKRAKRTAKYFVPKHGLAPGVYRRDQPGGVAVRILKFTDAPSTYAPRLGFYDGAEDVYRTKLPEHLSRTLAKMVAKRAGTA